MNDAHRVIVVIENKERNPYEVWLLAALFLSSIVALLSTTFEPASIEASLPPISRIIWYLQVAMGTSAVLIGMFWRQPVTSRTIQIAGHMWTGSGALIYGCVLFYYNGLVATMAGLMTVSVALAAVVKAYQLRKQVKTILQSVREQNGASVLSNINGGDRPIV